MEKYDEKLFSLLRRRIEYDLRIEEQVRINQKSYVTERIYVN